LTVLQRNCTPFSLLRKAVEGMPLIHSVNETTISSRQIFRSRNFLDWMTEFESKLKLKSIGPSLMVLAVANNQLIEQVQEIARKEVDGSATCEFCIFLVSTTALRK